jgi:hypothetical protein
MGERKPLPGREGHYETSEDGVRLHNLRTGRTTSAVQIAAQMGSEEIAALHAVGRGRYDEEPLWALFSIAMGGLANGSVGPVRESFRLELTDLGRAVAIHLQKIDGSSE